jgi:hypothetical protein
MPMSSTPRLVALSAFAAVLWLAGEASADKLLFSGEHGIKFSYNGGIQEVVASGSGVAIVNGSAGGSHLNTLELTRPFATISATVTDTPGVGIDEVHFDGIKINPLIAGPGGNPGSFAPFGATLALTRSTLPVAGTIRLCNLAGCPSSFAVDLDQQTTMGVAVGVGVGGSFTVGGPTGMTRVSVQGAPWTIGTTTVSYRTTNGAIGTFTGMGFVQGPASNTSSTAANGGVVQLVSGTQTTSVGLGELNDVSGQISRLTLTFAPEPSLLLLLGAGAVSVALLGRKRIQR